MSALLAPSRARNAGSRRTRSQGFTLIELLVVIAIIAILIAIIFPVFSSVLENQRQATTMSNMKQISTALAQFKLDNHKAPDVLFGYAVKDANGKVVPIKGALAAAQAAGTAATYFPGLYPTYIKQGAEDVFQDQNNPDTNKFSNTVMATVGVLCPSPDAACTGKAAGTRATKTQTFYVSDAQDVSPQVTGTNAVNAANYVARYQSSWTDLSPAAQTADVTNYSRQLRFLNPPANTYVTSVTYHVPRADKVLVLLEGGNVKKMTGGDFGVHDNGNAPDFWKVSP